MGIDPTIFGKYFWGTMHLTALGAPTTFDASHVAAYKMFFNQIPYVIPCTSCGEHLLEIYAAIPMESALSGSEALFEWTVKIHNAVNKRLGKPEVSVADARAQWMPTHTVLGFKNDKSAVFTNKFLAVAVPTAALVLLACGGYFVFSMRQSQSKHVSARR